MSYRTREELDASIDHVRAAPADGGVLELIVRRPAIGTREVLDIGELDVEMGLVGDTWRDRPSRRTEDGTAHPDMQLNIMNWRAISAICPDPDRRPLAGDQLYLDLDLSDANLPAGTRLTIGDAVIEITDQPHTGCAKFAERFGADARRWINSDVGTELHLRGINAKVVRAGTIRRGDIAEKV